MAMETGWLPTTNTSIQQRGKATGVLLQDGQAALQRLSHVVTARNQQMTLFE
jgi:hypothetical protein